MTSNISLLSRNFGYFMKCIPKILSMLHHRFWVYVQAENSFEIVDLARTIFSWLGLEWKI